MTPDHAWIQLASRAHRSSSSGHLPNPHTIVMLGTGFKPTQPPEKLLRDLAASQYSASCGERGIILQSGLQLRHCRAWQVPLDQAVQCFAHPRGCGVGTPLHRPPRTLCVCNPIAWSFLECICECSGICYRGVAGRACEQTALEYAAALSRRTDRTACLLRSQ